MLPFRITRILFSALFLLSFAATLPAQSASPDLREGLRDDGTHPRNIVLLIGDGMGTAHLSLLRLMDQARIFDAFPVAGFSQTESADHLVTESAAAATALGTGVRTNSRIVGLAPDGSPLRNLLERARERGKSTGVVVTSSVTHATPAAFMAHVSSRELQYDIAEQIAASGPEVVMGGGKKFFLPKNKGGGRADGRDLTGEMADAGYRVILGDAASAQLSVPANVMPGDRLLFLGADDGLPSAGAREVSLRDMVMHALALLSAREAGFVLVVEGSQIDWAGHDNDFTTLKKELRDFHDAVGEVLSFARSDGSTAVIVTADHETGGLALVGQNPDGSDVTGLWVSGDHTASMVPVLAAGPGSARFGGIHRNDEIGQLLQALLSGD